MSKLGLIGGIGPESTISYYKAITDLFYEKTGSFPQLNVESLSVFNVLHFVDAGDKEGLANYISEGIKNLTNAGADFAALTGITPHVVIDQIKKAAPIPVVSLLDTTLAAIKDSGARKVLLLGTKQTMQNGFFEKYLREHGVPVVIPDSSDVEYIGNKIETELELGVVLAATQARFKEIVEKTAAQNHCDLLILGCTELPLIFKGMQLAVPALDVTEKHINKLVSILVEK